MPVSSALLLAALALAPADGIGQAVTDGLPAPSAEAAEDASSLGPDASPPGADLEIFLVTVDPGTSVASRFGHSAIRVRSAGGGDRAFSFGQSNLEELSAASSLLQARLETTGSREETRHLLERYASQGRTVWMQRLNLLPQQRATLLRILEDQRGTMEGAFRYDVFRDNCTTAVRDVLNAALDGRLRAGSDRPSPTTYRSQVARYTAPDLALYALTNLLMADVADQPISAWDELFLPETLREWVRTVSVMGPDGSVVPLLADEEVLPGAARAEIPPEPPAVWRISLTLGVLLASAFAILGARAAKARWARVGFAVLGGGWSLTVGLAGVALLALWAFSDQALVQRNENLFQVSPLSLLLALAAWASLEARRRTQARWLATATAGLALTGLLLEPFPGFDQRNAVVLALTLPAHLGLAWGMWQWTAPDVPRTAPDAAARSCSASTSR